ncbi:MAG: hypothetical protein V9G29_13900 [Burkholderiaceae bacterium]
MLAACPCFGIGMILHRQHAVQNGNPLFDGYTHQALRAAIGDMLIVPRIAAHHASQRQDRRMPTCRGQLRGNRRNLPGPRHAHQIDRLRGNAVIEQGSMRTGDQRIDDARIPATRDDRKAGVGRAAQLAFDQVHGISTWSAKRPRGGGILPECHRMAHPRHGACP